MSSGPSLKKRAFELWDSMVPRLVAFKAGSLQALWPSVEGALFTGGSSRTRSRSDNRQLVSGHRRRAASSHDGPRSQFFVPSPSVPDASSTVDLSSASTQDVSTRQRPESFPSLKNSDIPPNIAEITPSLSVSVQELNPTLHQSTTNDVKEQRTDVKELKKRLEVPQRTDTLISRTSRNPLSTRSLENIRFLTSKPRCYRPSLSWVAPAKPSEHSGPPQGGGGSDVSRLIDRHFRSLLPSSKWDLGVVERQVRDLLLIRHKGDLRSLEIKFLIPAARLLSKIKDKSPELLDPSGLIHLSPPESCRLRPGDAVVCVTSEATSLELWWREAPGMLARSPWPPDEGIWLKIRSLLVAKGPGDNLTRVPRPLKDSSVQTETAPAPPTIEPAESPCEPTGEGAPLAIGEDYASDPEESRGGRTLPPRWIEDVDSVLLESEVLILPGTRDERERILILLSSRVLALHPEFSPSQLAKLLRYLLNVSRRDPNSRWVILVDGPLAEKDWAKLETVWKPLQGAVDVASIAPDSPDWAPLAAPGLFPRHMLPLHLPCGQLIFCWGSWLRFRKIFESLSPRRRNSPVDHEGVESAVKELGMIQTRYSQNQDYRWWLEQVKSWFFGEEEDPKEAVDKLKSFQEKSSQIVEWIDGSGSCALRGYLNIANSSSTAIREQEERFDEFYFHSMRQIELGNDLVEEISSSTTSRKLQQMTKLFNNKLTNFSEQLEDTRETLEDASKCYQLIEKSFGWALETMKLVSHMKMEGDLGSLHGELSALQRYMAEKPPIPASEFQEAAKTATQLGNRHLVEQIMTAQQHCLETAELAQRRQTALVQAQQQMEEAASIRYWSPAPAHIRRQSLASPPSSYTSFPSSYYGSRCFLPSQSPSSGPDDLCNLLEGLEVSGSEPSPPPRNTSTPVVANRHISSLTCNVSPIQANRTCHLIIQEMIQTERDYVKSLEYIIENYIPEMLREDVPQGLRGQRNTVFGNLEKIYEFHSNFFLQELEECENRPFSVGHCFTSFESQFYLYALYNKNKPRSDILMADHGALFFKEKQLQLGDKMDLGSYLLKPVQRLGKYALLLEHLIKECHNPSTTDARALKTAEELVKFQLRHGNDLLAMDALKDCDVNLKEQGRLLCQDEFVVSQGSNRLQQHKAVRRVFLFEELVVFSKAKPDPQRPGYDHYQYKFSLKTCELGLTREPRRGNSTCFEVWFRKCRSQDTYTLQAHSQGVKQAWVEQISRLLWSQAMRNRDLRMAENSSMGMGSKPCLEIRPSQDNISDRFIQLSGHKGRFRNSIAVDCVRRCPRPQSIISVSSSSSGHSGIHKSDSSHCSTESGFFTDLESDHRRAERSDSLISSVSCTSTSPDSLDQG